MTRIMRDSTTAADIPLAGTQLAAGYVNGRFVWSPADWARFPGIPHVRIDVTGADPAGADVLDTETGDASPATANTWLRAKIARGDHMPVIYCNRSTQPLVEQATGNLIHGRDYWFWIATLDGTQRLPDMTGVVAVQYAGQAQTGAHYDQSIVYDDAWMPSAPPPPPSSGTQSGWAFCGKCKGLFYRPEQSLSHCPAGGQHDGSHSLDYELPWRRL
jgi:hypothetical protein